MMVQVRAWLIEVANFIADPHTEWPVLVHCRAGKDRTGVVVAMLLKVIHSSSTVSRTVLKAAIRRPVKA